MYTRKLALFALVLGTTVAYPYPAASRNPESLGIVAAPPTPRTIEDPRTPTLRVKEYQRRQIHNADYHANGPPPSPNPASAQDSSPPSPANSPDAAPSEPTKDKRAETSVKHGPAPIVSSPREKASKELDVEESNVAMKKRSTLYPGTNIADCDPHAQNLPPTDPDATALRVEADQKRQIHNADYHANGPPPSPNPAPAQESSSPSPANPSDATPSEPNAKDKRAESSIEHSPRPVISSSSSSHEKAKDVEQSRITRKKRSMDGGPAHAFGGSAVNHRVSKLVARIADGDWYGLRRRNVEELTNLHNRDFDHYTVTRWSRAEADKMQAWSKLGYSNV
ncbi:hypothetical protein B0H13DRAFT_923379 [Mycena leptocephala]|nr:hypothetical protein B0H13DRAFT_923379 [Mycena leptocephala]